MSGKVIDSGCILNVNPDWSYGRNNGFTDEETARIADDTYWEMERFYEKYRTHKWPEEKPEKGHYLIARRYKYGDGQLSFITGSYWFDQLYSDMISSPESVNADDWGYIPNPEPIKMCWTEDSDEGCRDISDEVVYWWNLPEVAE